MLEEQAGGVCEHLFRWSSILGEPAASERRTDLAR
jgi:hypothetical protein